MLKQADFRRIETWGATLDLKVAGGRGAWRRIAEGHALFKLICRRCSVADLRARINYVLSHEINHENSRALVLYLMALEREAPVAARSLAERALAAGGIGVCEQWVLEGMIDSIGETIFADVRANRELGVAVAV